MFNKLLGKNNDVTNQYYQKKISEMFNTDEGKKVLAWLIRTHVFSDKSGCFNLTDLQHAYMNGRIDFIKLLVKYSDFDFSIFEGN